MLLIDNLPYSCFHIYICFSFYLFADGFMGDIAVSNINYESEWQTQKLNKTFQQELERMKQEVYHEGLQVEEEGLTDIIRKKTKIPHMDTANLNEPSKNNAILLVCVHLFFDLYTILISFICNA